MSEREPDQRRISSFFSVLADSAGESARTLRRQRRAVFNWASQGNSFEKTARLAIAFGLGLSLAFVEGGEIFVKDSSKFIAKITKNRF